MTAKLKHMIPTKASDLAPFATADAVAIQAMAKGEANSDQQKRVLKWILESACALPIWAFRDQQRETDIALGRHHVGQQIVGLMKVNISRMKKEDSENAG